MRNRWPLAAAAIGVALAIAWLLARGGGKSATDDASSRGRDRTARANPRIDKHGGAPASLAGTVKTTAGAAIAGAWVCATPGDDDLGAGLRDPRCATTGAGGGWTLGGLFPGHWSVTAGADGKIPIDWRGPDDRRVLPLRVGEARTGVDLVLAEGGVRVTGTVQDLTGGPVVGALVSIDSDARGRCLTRSGDGGAFRCWTAPGPSSARASADGYTEGFTMLDAPEDAVQLLLTPESTLEGTVVLAGTHEPVAGAWVDAPGALHTGATAITDAAGHFHLAHLAPGRYKPSATAPALYGEAAESVQVGIAQSKDGLLIEMHPAATVRGTVTLAGKPVDDCSVSLGAKAAQYDDRTDDDGTVTFDAVQPGSYRVRIECSKEIAKPPYADVVITDQPIEVAWEVDAGATLTGIVVDDAGAPVANVTVMAPGNSGGGAGSTDADGRFTLAGLAPGRAHLMIETTDHVPPDPPVEVDIGRDHDVRIVLATGGEITGTVVTASGAPVAGVDIHPESTDARVHVLDLNLAKTHDDGSFTLRGVRPGNYRVVAMRDWKPLRRPGATDGDKEGEPVSVAVDKPANVRIVVEDASGSIHGKVVDATGAPVSDAFLRAERESDAPGARRGAALESAHFGWFKKPSVTSTDGTFTIGGHSPGNYTVLAYREGGSEAEQDGVAVGASVTLTIARGGSLSGTVTSPSGPPRDVAISVFDQQTGFQRSDNFFLGEGRWAIRDVPAGRYDIVATTADGKAKLEGIALGEGEDRTGIELALAARVTVTGRLVDAVTHTPIARLRVFITPSGEPFSVETNDLSLATHPTGDDGRFDVPNVPIGKAGLMAAPAGRDDIKYAVTKRPIDVEGAGLGPVDLGDIALRASRLPPDTRPGDLGFELVAPPVGADRTSVELAIASVDKDGPAAASGLQVGDVIVAVDGNDVRGDNAADYDVLTSVPEGTAVAFTLARGVTVKITAGKPR